jgi:hypothetical protein
MGAVRRLLLALVIWTLLAAPSGALGATRFASPDGGEAAPCPQSAPCSLTYAITAASTGDEVVVAPGSYQVAETIIGTVPLTVRGIAGPVRPRIVGAAKVIPLGFLKAVTVSDLTIEGNEAPEGALAAVAPGDVFERLQVTNSGTAPGEVALFLASDWTLTDSLIVAAGPSAVPLAAQVNADGTGTMRNDTVVANGEKTFGIAIFSSPKKSLTVRATGVIVAAATATEFQGTESMSSLAFDHSDVQGKIEVGSPVTSIEAVGAPPQFVDPAQGDYREAPGSPTIDAGVNDPANRATDLDGNPRSLPGRLTCTPGDPPAVTDIGALEFVPAPVTCASSPPPSTPALTAPGTFLKKTTIKGRTARFLFGSLASPATGFECKLDAGPWLRCASPKTYKRLRPGHHTFRVRSLGPGGTDATPVRRKFKIRRLHPRHRRH